MLSNKPKHKAFGPIVTGGGLAELEEPQRVVMFTEVVNSKQKA